MKKFTLMLAGIGIAAAALPATANAQGWQTINARQANLDRRIDMGIRNGQLSRREAVNLRAEFRQISRLESRYRANGLNRWERQDLDRRFDVLSRKIRWERQDRNGRRH
jgi:hypothetical protein